MPHFLSLLVSLLLLLPVSSHASIPPSLALGATVPANNGQPGHIWVVSRTSGEKRLFSVGQEVSRGVLLTHVGNRLALFRVANQDKAVAVGQALPRNPYIEVSREWLMALALDVPALAEQVRLRPVSGLSNDASPDINPNTNPGFLVEWLSADAFNQDLGIQRGDILNHLNNIPLTPQTDVWNLFAELSRLDQIHLHITRQGRPITLKYQLH